MGARIPSPARIRPRRWRTIECPSCGHAKEVINGEWLRDMRLRKGLSQRAAGEQIGISSPYLSDLESNRRECPFNIEVAYSKLRMERNK